ncbi:hypothetical protein J6590_072268 [Homalodisca vitripennis]|nr:hypothetical protein J6590_072268 [Homalodisca vitripennis]
MAGTNDVAIGQRNIYKHLERCFTSKLRTAMVMVSTLSHRHELPTQHPINKETSLINAYKEEFCVGQSRVEVVDFNRIERGAFTNHGMHLKPQCTSTRLLGGLLVECMGGFSRAVRTTSRDFNIEVLDQTNPLTQRLRDILTSFGLVWSENTPTRVSATWSTAIENVHTNVLKVSVSVLDPAISDHFAQEAVV